MSLLWKIPLENGGSSYLFGTMHVPDSRVFHTARQVIPFIDEVGIFAAEFNLDDMATGVDYTEFRLPEGTNLKDWITEKRYEKLKKILLKSIAVNLDNFQFTLPFVTANVISEKVLYSDMGQALDEYLWEYSKSVGKSMRGIETFQEQLETLRQIPIQYQIAMLLETGRNISHSKKNILHLMKMYLSGDVYRLYKSVKKNSRGLRKPLLYQRNEIMADRIASMALGKETFFVAVGAGHLAGGKGLIYLLKRKKVQIRPVWL